MRVHVPETSAERAERERRLADAERAEQAANQYVRRHNSELDDIVRLAQSLWEYSELRASPRTVASLQRLVAETEAIRKLRNLGDRSRIDPVHGPKARRPTKRTKAMANLANAWDGLANLYSVALPERQHDAKRDVRPRDAVASDATDLADPVCVADIAKNLTVRRGGGRSDKLAASLRRKGARMQKLARKWHIEREDAKRLLPGWRKWAAEHPDA